MSGTVLQSESPIHRAMILLKAQGLSNIEIAQRLDRTPACVSMVLRQPWARVRLLEELNAQGRPPIQQLLAASAYDSVQSLIDARDDEKARRSERIAAANSLLDRFMGKATTVIDQHVTHEATTTDLAAMQRELTALEAEEKRLKGN
jgi:hypothetical protein